ncbi:MAG: YMGG-like glycine zipper-containing protein [Flavisolibacter sp.]
MKVQAIILGTLVFVTACNSKPGADATQSTTTPVSADTTGLAAFQAMKAENELGAKPADGKQSEKSSVTTVKKSTSSGSSSSNSTSTHDASGTSTHNSSGTSTAQGSQKKGWSKTAKGAVIGGVVGAGTGAVIDKKHRGAGAVIGGVLGAGTGAVIGNDMDKKDGRH